MKPGITQLCLSRQDLEEDLKYTRDAGYEAIELVFSDIGSPYIGCCQSGLPAASTRNMLYPADEKGCRLPPVIVGCGLGKTD
jgi:hypothetical protein